MLKLWTRLFVAQTNDTKIQFFRYFFVGGLAFSSDFLLLYILTSRLGVYYLVSAPISYIFGVVINYWLSTKWIFKGAGMQNKLAEFTFFILIGVAGLGLNQALMWLCTGVIGLFYLYSKIFSTVIVYLWNFFARKWFLYGKRIAPSGKIEQSL